MESSSNPENPTQVPEATPQPVEADVFEPNEAAEAPEMPPTEPPSAEASDADLSHDDPIQGELPPKLVLDDAVTDVPAAPDLDAVAPPAPPAPAPALSLDLPSLELPNPGYGQPEPQQVPQPPAYQTPYAVPEPPAPPGYGQPAYGQPQYGQPQYGQQQVPQYGQQLAYPAAQLSPADENMWSGAAHWSALLASVVGLGFLGPLLVLLTQGSKSARVRANAVESLNFEITFIISMVVSVLLILVVVGIVTSILIPIAWLILRILAAVQTTGGQDYRYPLNIRLVK